MSAYSAKALVHTALQPAFLTSYQRLGLDAELFVQASEGAKPQHKCIPLMSTPWLLPAGRLCILRNG